MFFVKKLMEGRLFRGTWKAIVAKWDWFWDRIDFYLGWLGRLIFAMVSKTDSNKVFFMTQESSFTCNPKYIYENLHERFPEVETVWRMDNKFKNSFPKEIKTVKYNSFEYFYEIFTSKVLVANSFIFLGLPFSLKKNQVLIQTWHGSLGLKKHSKEVIKDKNSKRRIHGLEYTGKRTDYLIVNSTLECSSLGETYWPDTKMLMYGHPRNDILCKGYEEKREEIKKKLFEELELNPETRIVMYAPTFRDQTDDYECYQINYDNLVETLSEKFGGEWSVLERYHPALSNKKKYMKFSKDYECKVLNVTSHPDMQELICITDVAITDYSSWIYDFVLMRRPGFIFATDIESYCENDRGFYYPIEETPFLIAKNNDELIDNISKFDMEIYQSKVEAFLKDKGCVDEGKASERTVDLIVDSLKLD